MTKTRVFRKSQWQNAVAIQGRMTQHGVFRKSLRRRTSSPASWVTQGCTGRKSRRGVRPPREVARTAHLREVANRFSRPCQGILHVACGWHAARHPGCHLGTAACHLRMAGTMACHLAFRLHLACRHDLPLGMLLARCMSLRQVIGENGI